MPKSGSCCWRFLWTHCFSAWWHHYYAVKLTYVHPASKELLQRCLCGAKQNANEPYKGLVWSFCPTQEEFCGAGDCGDSCQPCSLVIQQQSHNIWQWLRVWKRWAALPDFLWRPHVCEKGTEEKRSNGGQEERKEGLRRAGSGRGRNTIWSRSCLNVFAQLLSGKNCDF